ncbi:MAG: hypothetical protein AB1401_10365 [Thermodesulfobacteriota bacterium]
MTNQSDNRMGWIRNIEKLEKTTSEYTAEYELASESQIFGVLDYKNGAIQCGIMTFKKDSNGTYKYLLRIKYPPYNEEPHFLKANKSGYLFPEGIPGELISILFLFFQCRFFLIAAYSGDLSSNGLKLKTEYFPQIKRCEPYFDPDMFPDGKRNFAVGLVDFLEKLARINDQYHQRLILGFYNYARALREFGIDEEMVFIRLVSSIEAFTKWVNLSENDDLFSGVNFENIIQSERLSASQKEELKNIFFNVRKAKTRFANFIQLYSKGFFTGGNFRAPHTRIKKGDLKKALSAIYDSRSNYLHQGETMYLSRHMRSGHKWDTDPTTGMIIDNRHFSVDKKLPYASFFQRLVRHCIMQFLSEISNLENT